jgi:hypothetical protein
VLRQPGVMAIPKAGHVERVRENLGSLRHYSVRSLKLPAICRVITIEDIVLVAQIRYAAAQCAIAVRSISSIG